MKIRKNTLIDFDRQGRRYAPVENNSLKWNGGLQRQANICFAECIWTQYNQQEQIVKKYIQVCKEKDHNVIWDMDVI